MGISHAREFWRNGSDEHQRLVQAYDENIELTHPSAVTGRSVGCGFCYHCGWCATKVIYPEYRGPRIDRL